MRSRNTIYGSSYNGSYFKIKCYNKTLETKLHYRVALNENILRFEIEVNDLRYLHQRQNTIPVVTYRDLYDYSMAERLFQDLLLKYRKIFKAPCLSDLELTPRDLRLLAVFDDPKYLQECKRRFHETYRKDRKKVKEILSNRAGLKIYDEVEQKLITKGKYLLASWSCEFYLVIYLKLGVKKE